ncbi:MFS general substrate transporter [Trametes elegans]|nr:MFS general substrate transporter [Trametes elegans]
MSSAESAGAEKHLGVDHVPSLHSPLDALPATGDGGVDPWVFMRKLDRRLLPCICLLYILSFLDRTTIGNANVAGLVANLRLTGLQYNICSRMFFVTYCVFGVPSNLMLKATSPSRWIPTLAFRWGVVLLCTAFVKEFCGLLSTRLFLGIPEAGLAPAIVSYICTRADSARRIATYSSTTSIAAAFGGLLAYAIENMDGLFLLEVLVAIVAAIFGYFVVDDILIDSERAWLLAMLEEDRAGLFTNLKAKFLGQALRDPYAYLMTLLSLFIFIPSYSFTLFLPTIILGSGYSPANARVLSIPPNMGGEITTVIMGFPSVRHRVRGPFLLASLILALVEYVITTTSPGAGHAWTVVASCGIFPSVAFVKRAVMIALVVGCGNLGGITRSFVYQPQDSPRYHSGHVSNVACLCVAYVICAVITS